MSAQDPTRVPEKPPDGSEPTSAHTSSRVTRSQGVGGNKVMPSSVSMPVDLHTQTHGRNTEEASTSHPRDAPLNPLYQLSVSKSHDAGMQTLSKQAEEGSSDTLQESAEERLQSREGDSQESVNQNDKLHERKLMKQTSHTDLLTERAPIIRCPRVNCPEKIILCLDLSEELERLTFRTRAGDKYGALQLLKRAISFFVLSKHRLDQRHEFALVTFQDTPFWECSFTTNPRDIIHHLEELIETTPMEERDEMDMDALFQIIQERVTLPTVQDPTVLPPPYTVRMVLFYGRSHCVPRMDNKEALKLLQSSPHFFVDAYYVHETPSDENKCEEIFDKICDLDHDGQSYVFEVGRGVTKIHNYMAQLLPHPLQRPLQDDAYYSLNNNGNELGT